MDRVEGIKEILKAYLPGGLNYDWTAHQIYQLFEMEYAECQQKVEMLFREIEGHLGIPTTNHPFTLTVAIDSDWWQALKKRVGSPQQF